MSVIGQVNLFVFEKIRNEPAEAETGRVTQYVRITNRRAALDHEEDDTKITLGESLARQFGR